MTAPLPDTAPPRDARADPKVRYTFVIDVLIIGIIGSTVLLSGSGITYLAAMNQEVPPALAGTASASLTALVSFLFRRQS